MSKGEKFCAFVKSWWPMVIILGAVVGFGVRLELGLVKAGEAKKMAEQNQAINAKLASIVAANDAKLQVYLEVMGFDEEIAREWARMPRKCTTDSTGAPILWEPWLEVKHDLDVGIRFMVNDSLDVLIDTLWDFREAKK